MAAQATELAGTDVVSRILTASSSSYIQGFAKGKQGEMQHRTRI